MIFLAVPTVGILIVVSVLHALWGARIWWPIGDEKALVQATAGFPEADRMPPAIPCFIVALLLAAAAIFAMELAGLQLINWPMLTIAGGGVITLVFLGRGLVGFTSFWAKLTPEQPFRSLDFSIYSPLCVALGVSFATLLWSYVAVL